MRSTTKFANALSDNKSLLQLLTLSLYYTLGRDRSSSSMVVCAAGACSAFIVALRSQPQYSGTLGRVRPIADTRFTGPSWRVCYTTKHSLPTHIRIVLACLRVLEQRRKFMYDLDWIFFWFPAGFVTSLQTCLLFTTTEEMMYSTQTNRNL